MADNPLRSVPIHRCRFIDWNPAAITAIAVPSQPLPAPANPKGKGKALSPSRPDFLAVGRANGNIELCEWANGQGDVSCPQAWVPRMVRTSERLVEPSTDLYTLDAAWPPENEDR